MQISHLYGNKIGLIGSLNEYLTSARGSIESVMASNEITRRIHMTGPLTLPAQDADDGEHKLLLYPAWTNNHAQTWECLIDPAEYEVYNHLAVWKALQGIDS